MVDFAGLAARGNGWSIPNMALLVPQGSAPPAQLVGAAGCPVSFC